MVGEKEFFRKRFFGGFNRNDVIKYIAKIAEERNEAIAAKEKAEKEARALAEELRKLRGEENPVSSNNNYDNTGVLHAVTEQPVEEKIETDLNEIPDLRGTPAAPEEYDLSGISDLRGTPVTEATVDFTGELDLRGNPIVTEPAQDFSALDDHIAAIKEIGQIKEESITDSSFIDYREPAAPVVMPEAPAEVPLPVVPVEEPPPVMPVVPVEEPPPVMPVEPIEEPPPVMPVEPIEEPPPVMPVEPIEEPPPVMPVEPIEEPPQAPPVEEIKKITAKIKVKKRKI